MWVWDGLSLTTTCWTTLCLRKNVAMQVWPDFFFEENAKTVSLATIYIYTIICQTWGCNPEMPQKWLMDQTGPNDDQTWFSIHVFNACPSELKTWVPVCTFVPFLQAWPIYTWRMTSHHWSKNEGIKWYKWVYMLYLITYNSVINGTDN